MEFKHAKECICTQQIKLNQQIRKIITKQEPAT